LFILCFNPIFPSFGGLRKILSKPKHLKNKWQHVSFHSQTAKHHMTKRIHISHSAFNKTKAVELQSLTKRIFQLADLFTYLNIKKGKQSKSSLAFFSGMPQGANYHKRTRDSTFIVLFLPMEAGIQST